MTKVRTCTRCGCTDDRACMTINGPCFWLKRGICSGCGTDKEWMYYWNRQRKSPKLVKA